MPRGSGSHRVQNLVELDTTITPLGGTAVYTSVSFRLNGYAKIVGAVFADADGDLSIQQSQDNVNWDVVSSVSVEASVGRGFSVEVLATNGRVVYTNGAGAQAVFRLHTNGRAI